MITLPLVMTLGGPLACRLVALTALPDHGRLCKLKTEAMSTVRAGVHVASLPATCETAAHSARVV